jgi:hypothetical protein
MRRSDPARPRAAIADEVWLLQRAPKRVRARRDAATRRAGPSHKVCTASARPVSRPDGRLTLARTSRRALPPRFVVAARVGLLDHRLAMILESASGVRIERKTIREPATAALRFPAA